MLFVLTIANKGIFNGLSHKDCKVKWFQCTLHFGTEQLKWPVLKGPEGLDRPWRLLSKQSSQS